MITNVSADQYCRGRVYVRSTPSWVTCQHRRTKVVTKEWITHYSVSMGGMLVSRSRLMRGSTTWCRGCNKILDVSVGGAQ